MKPALLLTFLLTASCAADRTEPTVKPANSNASSKGSPTGSSIVVGARAPDGDLVDHTGAPARLASAWRDGPAILVFYRGFW